MDTKNSNPQSGEQEVIEGELVTGGPNGEEVEAIPDSASQPRSLPAAEEGGKNGNQRGWLLYVVLPIIFLTVALLGGLRIAAATGEFIFVRPALICLIFATLLTVLFFRAGLIKISGWFSESIPTVQNAANAAVLAAMFGASVQIFNSLLPERGLPFWVVSFCFLWILGVSYFSVSDPPKLVRTTVALFVLAFLTKYFLLAALTSSSSGSWLQRLWDDPTREAITYLLDLPRYSSSTGYIQFFAAGLFLLGLFLVPATTKLEKK